MEDIVIGEFTFTKEFITIYKSYFIKSFKDKTNYFIPDDYDTWICLSIDKHEKEDLFEDTIFGICTHIEEYPVDSSTAIHFMHIKKQNKEIEKFVNIFKEIKNITSHNTVIYKPDVAHIFSLVNDISTLLNRLNTNKQLNTSLLEKLSTFKVHLSPNGIIYLEGSDYLSILEKEMSSSIQNIENPMFITNDNIDRFNKIKLIDIDKLINKLKRYNTDQTSAINAFNILGYTIKATTVMSYIGHYIELTTFIKDDKQLLFYSLPLSSEYLLKTKIYKFITDSQLNRMFNGRDFHTLTVPIVPGHAHPIHHPLFVKSGSIDLIFWKEYNSIRMMINTYTTGENEIEFDCISIKPKNVFFLPEENLLDTP